MNDRAMIYITIGIIIVALALVFFAYNQSNNYGANYQKALSSELADICQTPSGYTEQEWREHMGHHPDRYAQCLNK